jgi:hypothetical protein
LPRLELPTLRRVHRLETPKQRRRSDDWHTALALSPDSRFVAVGYGNLPDVGWDLYAGVWDLVSGSVILNLDRNNYAIWDLDLSPDGRY